MLVQPNLRWQDKQDIMMMSSEAYSVPYLRAMSTVSEHLVMVYVRRQSMRRIRAVKVHNLE